jgi:AAA15 family ATPase/GTPase
MLVSFSVENYRSFREEVGVSTIASNDAQNKKLLAPIDALNINLLPVTFIIGPNASGKSNFFYSLMFVRQLIIEGIQRDNNIPVEPFRLDRGRLNSPSRFKLAMLIENKCYHYSFDVNQDAILSETLIEYIANDEGRILFSRTAEEGIKFEKLTEGRDGIKLIELDFIKDRTEKNQLFFTRLIQDINEFTPIYKWLRYSLQFVGPYYKFADSGSFADFFKEDHPNHQLMNKLLKELDTGIENIGYEEISFDALPATEEIKNNLRTIIKAGHTYKFIPPDAPYERYSITGYRGKISAKRLITFHKSVHDGAPFEKFELHQESDGTRRLIDLIPVFIDLFKENKTYIIDELDRSLHVGVFKALLKYFITNRSKNSQLIFTTHNLEFLEWADYLRNDGVWLCEKTNNISKLISLAAYEEAKDDKYLKQSYLSGRMTYIPSINNDFFLGSNDE